MKKKKWVICSGPDWYRPSITSTKQLIRQFRINKYSVLWINPIAFKSPFVNSTTRSSALNKIKNKLRTHLRFISRDSKNFWVLTPFYLPSFGALADRSNNWFVRFQVRLCCLLLGIPVKESFLWISGSFTAESLLDWPFHKKIYQAADLISEFRNASPELRSKLEWREKNLCRKVDAIFPASEKIAEKLAGFGEKREKIHLLHHGVDYEHFSRPIKPADKIQQIRATGKPVAGYFGSVTDANDKEVFLALAENGFSVVIIGMILGDYSRLKGHIDIHMLGPIPYDELPAYAAGFDVALLNWRMHDWILNCFPVKTMEYLAMGLPVVSCKIPVLMKHFVDEISFAETPAEFVQEAQKRVIGDSMEDRKKRSYRMRDWSWQSRYEYIREVLQIP